MYLDFIYDIPGVFPGFLILEFYAKFDEEKNMRDISVTYLCICHRFIQLSRINHRNSIDHVSFIDRQLLQKAACLSFRLRTGANGFVNRSAINCTPLMPGAVSPIDDQQLIGACENVSTAVAHVRKNDWQTSRPRTKWMANAQK